MTDTNEKPPNKGGFIHDLETLIARSQSVPAFLAGGTSGECDVGCACLGLSSVDQKLLRWRKELFEELCRSGQAGTSTHLATLRRESRVLHHLLFLSGSGELLRAEQLPYSDVEEQM